MDRLNNTEHRVYVRPCTVLSVPTAKSLKNYGCNNFDLRTIQFRLLDATCHLVSDAALHIESERRSNGRGGAGGLGMELCKLRASSTAKDRRQSGHVSCLWNHRKMQDAW